MAQKLIFLAMTHFIVPFATALGKNLFFPFFFLVPEISCGFVYKRSGNEIRAVVTGKQYTLFQNGRDFSILLFTCKLALVASFLNSKFKRIFSLKRGNKG